MDQSTLVTDELEGGRKLVERLISDGFDVSLAFWLNETDAGRWYLYLVSPEVDDKGTTSAYGIILPVVESMPELGIDPFTVKVVGSKDSIATAAQEVVTPKLPGGPFAVPDSKPYRGMTRFGGSALGGVGIDGAYIYPPARPGVSA